MFGILVSRDIRSRQEVNSTSDSLQQGQRKSLNLNRTVYTTRINNQRNTPGTIPDIATVASTHDVYNDSIGATNSPLNPKP